MEKIKITHINPNDIGGGAAIAGYRLHKEFLKYPEIDSVLFVRHKYTQDKKVIRFSNFFIEQIERVLNKFGYFTGLQYFLSLEWLPLIFKKRFFQTDVFIVRMIHGGYLPFWFPFFLSKIAPVIWRFPDMWAFTGHCCYSYDCQKWKTICKNCPRLKDYPALFIDTTSLLFKLKKFFYSRSNLYIVAPSSWMFENAKQSPILKNLPVFHIPTAVDIDVFQPGQKFQKLSIIFVSACLKDERKGIKFLPDILSKLNKFLKEKNIFLDFYLAGENEINLPYLSNINYNFLGKLKEKELANYYQKVHLSILPALADNLPNTILESLACETPVVCFDVGGCKDAVLHLKTGYLAQPYDIDDFVNGIITILSNPLKLKEMGKKSRELILEKFTQKHQAEGYLKLIKDILKK